MTEADEKRLAGLRAIYAGEPDDVVGAFLLRLLDTERAENARLKFGSMEGHEKPCYYCGEPCNDLAGNPGLWSVPGCHADDPGRVKWHHIKCVFPKADRATQAESALAAARERVEKLEEIARDWIRYRETSSAAFGGIGDRRAFYKFEAALKGR